MKRTFVHCADVSLEDGADPAAPGGAITLELCGSWDHPGPCRWPHETSGVWDERRGKIRVVFLACEEEENYVRQLISKAIAKGLCVGPDRKTNRWTTTNQHSDAPSEADDAWAAKLDASRGSVP